MQHLITYPDLATFVWFKCFVLLGEKRSSLCESHLEKLILAYTKVVAVIFWVWRQVSQSLGGMIVDFEML